MKKYLFLVFVIFTACMNMQAEKSGICGDSITWTLDDNGTLRISGNGRMYYFINEHGLVDMPWAIDSTSITTVIIDPGVKNIPPEAFILCSNLTSVSIPNTIEVIGAFAFARCGKLLSITIPSSVESCHDGAFIYCINLKKVTINSNSIVSSLKYGRTFGEQVKEYIIGEGVTAIPSNVFARCVNITSVSLPNSITSIGDSAFMNCTSLPSVDIPQNVTSIGKSAFSGCSGLSNEITIPDGITTIAGATFYGCSSLPAVTIPNSVTTIGYSAFSGCSSLSSINIPQNVTSIGSSAFSGCSSLSSIDIPQNVTRIEGSAFSGCSSLSSINIPQNVTSIGSSAFYGCSSLDSINIPQNVTSIGSSAFYGCSGINSIYLPDQITTIGSNAFYGSSKLKSVSIPQSLTSLGEGAFCGCSNLKSVAINANSIVSKDYESKFIKSYFGDQVTEYIIGDNVTKIGNKAFYNCPSLKYITIPDNVTEIGEQVFEGCGNLESVVIGNGIKTIPYATFATCKNLSSVNIPNGVTDIGPRAFSLCVNLSSILLPSSIRSIGWRAFSTCDHLTSITIPNGVELIDKQTFISDSSLISISLPSSLKEIREEAFANCPNIETIICYNTTPPSVIGENFCYFDSWCRDCLCNYYITLYVPAASVETYKKHSYWEYLDIRPIETDSINIENIQVIPADYSADVLWPYISNAYTYEWIIKDTLDSLVSSHIFNEQGQLITNTFRAPVNKLNQQETPQKGFRYTITGLDYATRYTYNLNVKDSNENIIKSLSSVFYTNGADIPTYTVNFYDWDESLLKTEDIQDGGNATPPDDPQREGYEFIGWQGDYNNISSDTDVYAEYRKIEDSVDNLFGEQTLQEVLANPATRIYSLQGIEVTDMRNNLSQGLYIFRLGEKAAKAMVK